MSHSIGMASTKAGQKKEEVLTRSSTHMACTKAGQKKEDYLDI